MKEKMTKNLGMKLLSLIIAALFWIIIVNIDDPVKTITISNIPVAIENENAIQSLNKVYDIIEGETISVKVKGKRSVVTKLKVSDFVATADLSSHNDFYAVPIIVDCPKYRDRVDWDITGKVSVMKIALEDVDTKQIKVTVVQEGKVEAGYYIGSAQPKPNMIEVSGAKSQIAKIEEVRVYLDVNGVYGDFKTRLAPQVFDRNGQQMDSSRMTFSSQEVSITVKVFETKNVPIYIDVKGTPAFGYQYVQTDYDPREVEIAGEEEELSEISLSIPIDIEGESGDVESEIDLSEYLPEGVKIVGDNHMVTIKVTIKEMITKDIILSSSNIKIDNLPENMKFNFVSPDLKISVRIMGLKEELEQLTAESLRAYIDLDGLELGRYPVNIGFMIDERLYLVNNPTVMVDLTDVNMNPGDDSEDPTASPAATTDGPGEESPDPTESPIPSSSPESSQLPEEDE